MVDAPPHSPPSLPESAPAPHPPARRRLWLPPTLFVLTLMTTSAVGALEYGLAGGMLYSASLVLILLCHEMGHYLTARHYRVPASLPYFIPVPLPPFGTFGAVIKMGGRIPDRKALFDIAVMGPAMGLVLALPLAVLGIAGSTVTSLDSMPPGETLLGPSILFAFLIEWIHGPLAAGSGLQLHPVATAGWAGLFVTALNLLPMGQLDGGAHRLCPVPPQKLPHLPPGLFCLHPVRHLGPTSLAALSGPWSTSSPAFAIRPRWTSTFQSDRAALRWACWPSSS